MKKTIWILLAAMLITLTGCGGAKILTKGTDRIVTDTVRITETLRDTTIIVEQDQALVRALVECDSLGQAHLKQLIEYKAGERLKPPNVTIKNNVLTAISEADSMKIYLTLKDRIEEHISHEAETVTKIVEVNVLTWWQVLWIKVGKIGLVLLILIGGWQAVRIVKRIKP